MGQDWEKSLFTCQREKSLFSGNIEYFHSGCFCFCLLEIRIILRPKCVQVGSGRTKGPSLPNRKRERERQRSWHESRPRGGVPRGFGVRRTTITRQPRVGPSHAMSARAPRPNLWPPPRPPQVLQAVSWGASFLASRSPRAPGAFFRRFATSRAWTVTRTALPSSQAPPCFWGSPPSPSTSCPDLQR